MGNVVFPSTRQGRGAATFAKKIMATRTKKDSVQLTLTIDGRAAEDSLKKLDQQNEKLVRQLFELEEQGKQTTGEYRKLKDEQQALLKQSNEMYARAKAASEQQQRLAVNEGKSLNQLQREYRQLNAIVKNLPPEHKDFNEQVDLLHKKKAKIDEMKKAFGQLRNNVKDTRDDLKQVGLNIGDLVTGGLVTGGIFAAVGLIQDAGVAVAETVEQMTELRRETQQLTGAVDGELDSQVIKIQALSTTFELEQREVLQAANAVQKEFGGSIEAALNGIENGLLAGADVSGEFLQNIQEYSVQFAAAGISAEEFIAVNTRAAKEGIFSDKGLDVVKEFGLRIREQTTATTRAMEAAFGKEFTQELFQNLNDGSIKTVDALKLVSREMNSTEVPAKHLQTVIADVFGGPGEDAGLRYIQGLQDIQTEIINLIDPTNEYVRAQMAQLAANEELATAQNELTKQLEDTGNSLSVFFSRAKAGAINVLVDVLQFFERFSATAKGIGAATKQFFTNLVNEIKSFVLDVQIAFNRAKKFNPFVDVSEAVDRNIAELQNRKGDLAAEAKSVGQAYREAFLEGMEEVDARKSASAGLEKDTALPVPQNFQGENQPLQEEKERQKEILDIQAIAQLEQIDQVALTEQEKKRILDESTAHAAALHQQEIDNTRNLEEYKRQQAEQTAQRKEAIEKAGIDLAKDAFGTTIKLLGQDAAARKKNAKAIKAFQTGQVFANLFEEISGIWKTANSSPLNILFPGAGTAIAVAKTAFATARAQLAVSSIQKQKFERGGIAQGASHAQGGIQLFDTASKRVVGEMEGGEPYLILSRDTYGNNKPIIDRLLHSSMYQGGAPIFANGGIFQARAIAQQSTASGSTDRSEELQRAILAEQQRMRQAIEAIPTVLKADVSIHQINDANETLADVRRAASL